MVMLSNAVGMRDPFDQGGAVYDEQYVRTLDNDVINIEGDLPALPTMSNASGVGDSTNTQWNDRIGNLSNMAEGLDYNATTNPTGAVGRPAQPNARNRDQYVREQRMLMGAKALSDVLNAQSQYNNISYTAQMNILKANQSAADAIARGQEAALLQQSRGYRAGEDATLEMVAQGQEVSGAATQRVQGSQEAIGIFNAMREETNAIREAMGYEQEAANYRGQIENARINRNFAVIGSALELGGQAYALR